MPLTKNKVLWIFGITEIIFAGLVLVQYLKYFHQYGFDPRHVHILLIGVTFLVLAIGSIKTKYWAWLLNMIVLSFYSLGYIYVAITTKALVSFIIMLFWFTCAWVFWSLKKQFTGYSINEK